VTLPEEIRPLGQEQWDEVVTRYNSEWAEPNERNTRDRDALRSQWYKVLRERKPTGDPSCPDHVRRAKRLNREMTNEIAMGGIDDDHLTASEHEAEAEDEAEGDGDNDKRTNDAEKDAAEKDITTKDTTEKEATEKEAAAKNAAEPNTQTESKSVKKDCKYIGC
jgi:hypothetical protein